jgi:hypothetical protein
VARGTAAALGLLVVAVLAGCAPTDDPARSTSLVVAPAGAGNACTTDLPCALATALETAWDGATVRLAPGDYGDLTLDDVDAVRVIGDAEAVIGKLDLDAPGTAWRGVTFTGGVYLDELAVGTVLDRVHVDGSGVFVRADDVVIRDSVIENGTSTDGIQVGGASRVLVEDSTVRGFGQGADSDVHSDCVQIFDSSEIVLRGNYLGGCDNAGLIFSPGEGGGIRDVVVEGNMIQGCVEKSERCGGGAALDLREPTAADVVVRNNTILDGSTMVARLDGLVFDRNIVGYLSDCETPMTNSIVAAWNTGLCERPDALGADGNREGRVTVRDRGAGDLRVVDPREATIDPRGGGEPAAEGYAGADLAADQAGAGG